MNVIFQDLFPETLLVQNEGGQPFTTSLIIAKHVSKPHKNIIRAIEQLKNDREQAGRGRLKFEPSSYVNEQNKSQPMYKLDRKACTLLILRLRGKNATIWQDDFYDQFEAMENYIKGALVRQADALYYFKPHFKTILAADAQNLPRSEIINLTGHKSTGSITANRRRMRDAGLLPAKNGGAA